MYLMWASHDKSEDIWTSSYLKVQTLLIACPEITGEEGEGMLSFLLAPITMSTVLDPFIANVNSCPHSTTESKARIQDQVKIPLETLWLLDHQHISQVLVVVVVALYCH